MKIRVVGQVEASGDEDESATNSYGKGRSKRFIITEHGNEQLQWNIPPRMWATDQKEQKTQKVNYFEVFDQLNAYFQQLPEQIQNSIFNEYKNIHEVLHITNLAHDDCEGLIGAIKPMAKKLFAHIDPANFDSWVWTKLRPTIPLSAASVHFDADTMPGTKERTYLLDDYKGLIPLAIIIRAACPFWFDFAALTREALSREHKDMHAYSLIEGSWPALSDAMHRLEEFVDHTVGNDRNNPASILMGIGTDEFVYWVLSSLVINKLPIVDVLGTSIETPVVSALYNHVKQRVTQLTSSQPPINNKFAESSYSMDENNQSYLEGFRNRIALPVGYEVEGDYYLERQIDMIMNNIYDPNSMIERVAPGIDYKTIHDAIDSSRLLQAAYPSDEQITIAAWLFHPYSQVRTIGNLYKERIVTLLAMAQAVLIYLNRKELAMLVTAIYHRNDGNTTTHYLGESISQLRATDKERYTSTFPMEQRKSNQKRVTNIVFDDVYNLVYCLQDYDITCTFSEATLKKVQGNNPNRKYFLRRDSVIMMMDFVKYLAERPLVVLDPDLVWQQRQAAKLGIAATPPANF